MDNKPRRGKLYRITFRGEHEAEYPEGYFLVIILPEGVLLRGKPVVASHVEDGTDAVLKSRILDIRDELKSAGIDESPFGWDVPPEHAEYGFWVGNA